MDQLNKNDSKSASYCCEAAGTLPAAQLPTEAVFPAPPVNKTDEAGGASYCCEAAGTLPAGDLPVEKPF